MLENHFTCPRAIGIVLVIVTYPRNLLLMLNELAADTVVLEFNQYTPGSRWRQTNVSRKNHREEGNEADGFYGGIRKIYDESEIATWKRLWPTQVLD